MAITGVGGKPGETARIRVRVADPNAVQSVTVNGVQQKFSAAEQEIRLEQQFAGKNYVRELDAWTQADGKRFGFPYHAAQPELKLTTTFRLQAEVKHLLEKAKPKNFAEMDAKIASWQTPDQIGRVMFFESGFGWMGQHPLRFNPEAQCWTAMVTPASRAMIQENDFIYIWAEGKDGLRSEYYPVKVGWDFTTKSRRPKVVAGAIEAESLKVHSKSKGRVEPQDMAPYGNHWSGDSQMVWWGGLEKGDQLTLELPVDKAGTYELRLHLTKAADYGTFSFQIDDWAVSEVIDIFDPELLAPFSYPLKAMTLSEGKHALRITYHGKNKKSTNSLIGMDGLTLHKTD